MFKNVKEDNVGLTWDPNNAGEAANSLSPMATASSTRRASSTSTCAITSIRMGRWSGRPSGEASSTIWARFARLLKDGYKETFTLETHWRDPKGKMYSTETSLTALLKVIEKV